VASSNIHVHFFGSPEFAVPSLQALYEHRRITVQCVVTQEDQPSGRGLKLQAPPAGKRARDLSIPLFQPSSLKKIKWDSTPLSISTEDTSIKTYLDFLNNNPRPDFFIVVAYGKILPPKMLEYPKIDTLNVHPSLLPRWRGAAPLQRTLLAGDNRTGVCIMSLVPELDAGPVYRREETEITENETLLSLHEKLSHSGANLLIQTILEIYDNRLMPVPQKDEGITYAEKWKKEESLISWKESAQMVLNRVKATSPRPGARTTLGDKELKVLKAILLKEEYKELPAIPGTLFNISKNRLGVICGNNKAIELIEIQIAGKKAVPTAEFLKGNQIDSPLVLGG
jgi:methionyl-tRNA formyltransferase